MERESNPMQPMCRSGCGFYGNPAQDGLCSVCYKDALRKKQQPPANSTPVTSNTASQSFSNSGPSASASPNTNTALPTVQSLLHNSDSKEKLDCPYWNGVPIRTLDEDSASSSETTSSTVTNSTSANDNDDKDTDGKKKKNRCATCRKKVGLTGFECRCGGLFCAVHRYSDKHDCTFDYREHGAAEIRRNNPVVVGEKIQKI